MEEQSGEKTTMTEPTVAPSTTVPAKRSGALVSVKSLLAIVACFGAIFWVWRSVEETRRPTLVWVKQVRSGDSDDRRIAARQLGDSNLEDLDLSLPSLTAALKDRDEAVRADVAAALGVLGLNLISSKAHPTESREVALLLVKALADDGAEVRKSAASSLGDFAHTSKVGGFPIEPSEMVSSIAGLLGDSSDPVRAQAERALWQISSATPLEPPPALLDGLAKWESTNARVSAAFVLGSFKLGPKATVQALARALKDQRPEVRSNAASSLQKFGANAVPVLPALIANINDSYVPPPEPAGPRVVAAVMAGQASTSVQVKNDPAVEAIHAIGAIVAGQVAGGEKPSPEVLEAVTKALWADRPAIKDAAEAAMRQMGKGASAAIPALIKNLAESVPKAEPNRGASAAVALGEIAPGTPSAPEAIATLISALEAKNYETRVYAVISLAKFGTSAKDALPRLRELSNDPNPNIASNAKTTVDKLEGKAQARPGRRRRG